KAMEAAVRDSLADSRGEAHKATTMVGGLPAMSIGAEVAVPLGAAELARRTMRLTAVRQLAPTPTNYRRAGLEAGGTDDAEGAAGPVAAGGNSPGACAREGSAKG